MNTLIAPTRAERLATALGYAREYAKAIAEGDKATARDCADAIEELGLREQRVRRGKWHLPAEVEAAMKGEVSP